MRRGIHFTLISAVGHWIQRKTQGAVGHLIQRKSLINAPLTSSTHVCVFSVSGFN
jgi:hypothetical protein